MTDQAVVIPWAHEPCNGTGQIERIEIETGSEHHPQCDGYTCGSRCPVPVPIPVQVFNPCPGPHVGPFLVGDCPHRVVGEHGGDEDLMPCPGLREVWADPDKVMFRHTKTHYHALDEVRVVCDPECGWYPLDERLEEAQ